MAEQTEPAMILPTPEQRPEADIVIYDGQCSFCRGHVERFARWDRAGRLAFLSLHDPHVYERFPSLDRDELMRHMVVMDRHGKKHAGAAAIRYLSRHLPRLWPLAPLLHLPGTLPLWQWCYGFVARQRYRLGGRHECTDESCHVHLR